MAPSQLTSREFLAARRKVLEEKLLALAPTDMREYVEVCALLQALGGFRPTNPVQSM